MSTYNGEKYILEQLQSIKNQTHTNWRLVVSDDGSSDNTLTLVEQFKNNCSPGQIEIREGPRKGFCQNFLSMACDVTLYADLYAFSDQDDVWLIDKLSRAITYFDKNSDIYPVAYGSSTQIVDEKLISKGISPNFSLPRSFRNALVQSIAGGNTQVFNQSAKWLLEQAGIQKVVSHDWWLYQLVQGSGGIFYFDPIPTLLYRQHSNALVGANTSIRARIDRLLYVLNGRFKNWNDMNCTALYNIRHLLTKDTLDVLDVFEKYRRARFKDRVRLVEVCGLYRQTWQGTLSLWLATIIKKI